MKPSFSFHYGHCKLRWFLLMLGCTGMFVPELPCVAQETTPVSFKQNVISPSSPVGFRIDVDIYTQESKPPVAQFKTLFTESETIEIDNQGERVTIFDASTDQLTVLNTRKRTMTVLETSAIQSMLDELLKQFPAPAEAAPQRDNAQTISLADSSIEYRVRTVQPDTPLFATRYAQFADATTKLNAVFPPYKPPQLRLQLNKILADEKSLPIETKRITKTKGASQEIIARLLVQTSFGDSDRKDLQLIRGWQDQFKFMSPNEFFEAK